jgi:hypothetical protein
MMETRLNNKGHFMFMLSQMVESSLETTRIFWRKKYFDASDDLASYPRPWAELCPEYAAMIHADREMGSV